MAFSSIIIDSTVQGDKRVVYGTYNSDSVTGGDIDTGLKTVESLVLQPTNSSVSANQPVVNETLPFVGSSPTIVCSNNETGQFVAVGS